MPGKKSKFKSNNVTIRVDLNMPIEKILDGATVTNLGGAILKESLKFMESGISPVTGKRFVKYKNTAKYPEKIRKIFPEKRNTPVNLKLTGDLYDSFGWSKKSQKVLTYGLLRPKGKAGIYGPVHNRDDEGRPDIPERKFLPSKRGERFNRTIMLEIKRIIVERLQRLLKK